MSLSLLRHTRPLMGVLGFTLLLLASCGDGSSPTASDESAGAQDDLSLTDDSGGAPNDADDVDRGAEGTDGGLAIAPGEPNPNAPLATVEDLVTGLVDLGVEAEYRGQSDEPSFFLPPPHLLTVNGEEVRVFAYETVEALKQDATKISPSAGMMDGTPVGWMEAPYFFARGTFLVLYVGVEESVIGVLHGLLGTPIAGQGAPTDDVSPPNPGIEDGVDRFGDPTLIVAGTEEEVEMLMRVVQDESLAESLQDVDLSQNWVVAVFRGQMPTSGYGIDIEEVYVGSEGDVVVTVSLVNPATDAMLAQVISYPMDVTVVARADVVNPEETDWVALTEDGQPLVRFVDGATSSDDGGIVRDGAEDPILDAEPDGPADDDVLTPDDVDSAGSDDVTTVGLDPALLKGDILGTITEVETYEEATAAGVLVRILIEGERTEETVYDKAWVEIVEDTALSFDGESFPPPNLRDLAPGRAVMVVFTGPVRESYPVQAVAEAVVILR